jgi:hypothetical protein
MQTIKRSHQFQFAGESRNSRGQRLEIRGWNLKTQNMDVEITLFTSSQTF